MRKLHVRAGHPSNIASVNSLKARGGSAALIEAARTLQCDDCLEARRSHAVSKASFSRANTLWHTLQVDIGQFKYKKKILHVLFLVDEASTFVVPHLIGELDEDKSMNASAEQVVEALQASWVRFFGHPSLLRCDPEGSLRSRLLEDWCARRDVELQPCAAEAHHQIGVVERMIGTIRKSVDRFLRSEEATAWEAVLAMCAAHNEHAKVGGFSPNQWALGRDPGLDLKMHESGRDGAPIHVGQRDPKEAVSKAMAVRTRAEEAYRRMVVQEAINRAWNSSPKKGEIYMPGDLVYYKRFQAPGQAVAHADVDVTRRRMARWFGPARVLATETLSPSGNAEDSVPGKIIWIVAAGRLKRVSPEQLRLASPRERLIEEGTNPADFPWTIHGMLNKVEKGEFDNYEDLYPDGGRLPLMSSRKRGRAQSEPRPKAAAKSSARVEGGDKSESRPIRGQKTPTRKGGKEGPSRAQVGTEGAPSAPREARARSRSPVGGTSSPSGLGTPGSVVDQSLHELLNNRQFAAARQRHGDTAERSRSSAKVVMDESLGEAVALLMDSEKGKSNLMRDPANSYLIDELGIGDNEVMACFSVDVPEDGKEFRQFQRDPEEWLVKKIKKSPEVSLSKMAPERIEDFRKAKEAEVTQWVRSAACRAVEGGRLIPKDRVMKMRWVLTVKGSGAAKARIVIVGFTDPDLASLPKASPTMSRRSRQLMATMAATAGWSQLKCDAKSAFLQCSRNTEESRSIFAVPPDELADAMKAPRGKAVQILKACYGLVNAPYQWFCEVRDRILHIGGEAIHTEPCMWIVRGPDSSVCGIIASHVDDFYMVGDEQDPTWNAFLVNFKQSYMWSPWEADVFEHCGIIMQQLSTGEIQLDHSKYCTGMKQIDLKDRDDHAPASPTETEQMRAILGAVQWRVQQSGPQHAAKLGQLLTMVKSPTVAILREVNKLVREVYAERHSSPRLQPLKCELEKVVMVCWTDAALANRGDGGSTGGYIVAAAPPALLEGRRSPVCMLSWRSTKLRRVARSSLAAEAQAFSEGEQELMWCRLQWREMLGERIDLQSPGNSLQKTPGVMVTDAKSLYDAVSRGDAATSGLGLSDKYSALEVLSVMERLAEAKTSVRWVHSGAQLADGLTKHQPSSCLKKAMMDGAWTLVADENFLSQKKRKKIGLADNPVNTEVSGKRLWGM